ncbi:hypothetical protein VTN02DRAFT_129 [Thermoascus thermophilus]
MPPKASEDELCQALLEFVTDGTYPESEDVVASEFPASAVPDELQRMSKAREEAEKKICLLSQRNASDVDGWISQAKQLHADIERSRLTAREIVAQHENTKPLQLKVDDASAKVELIKTEIAFNQAVTEALEDVQRLCLQLDAGRRALAEGSIMDAIGAVEATEKAMEVVVFSRNTNVASVLAETTSGLRRSIIDSLRVRWDSQVKIDRKKGELVIADPKDDSLEHTIAALLRLDMLHTVNETFQKDLIASILNPILLPNTSGQSHGVSVGESGIRLEAPLPKGPVSELLDRIVQVLGYLRRRLPTSISDPLSETIIPAISSKLISFWLSPAIPTDLDGLDGFEDTLDRVLDFARTIESFGWRGPEELVSWVNQAPRLWLTRRRVDSLDQVRRLLAASQGTTKKVERVEKEKVSSNDEVLLEGGSTEDWDAGWGNDNEDESTNPAQKKDADDDEDVSAWDLDVETEEIKEESKPAATESTEDDDAGDAWGWGDEDEDLTTDKVPAAAASKPANGQNGTHPSQREITLTEYYTVTDIPDSVLALILRQITDSKAISQPKFAKSRVASSGAGLLALPTLILAMFKATAPSFYTLKLNNGNMYLYNDSMYLEERLRSVIEEHQLTRLDPDVEGLDRFGKHSYSKEMQTQRIIVTDLLDGAQGFTHCSEQPFLGNCENAISATVDRIRDVYKEWQPILSRSALLQSVGSLISAVINKMIIDIEDLGDISEAQSQRLVSFCNQVSKLEDLFMPEARGETEPVSMAAVYVRNWLKFQYLINILESSLADIKFLWTEGELRLEFSPEEVIDLIEALFAESEHRRRAIAEIRRASRG